MTTYVALLRGIMPMNPNMRGEKLRGAFEGLGFKNVRTVIASGNVVFESAVRDRKKLETMIEKELPKKLKFSSTTIVRTETEIAQMIKKNPFKGYTHGKTTYLTVTFFKKEGVPKIASVPKMPGYAILGAQKGAIFNVGDNTALVKTPDVMGRIERAFGKEITTRTWKTVERILAVMERG